MADPQDNEPELPIGAVDASGEPTTVAGVTPPTTPAMVDEDGRGEANGENTDDLLVQGGE